MANRAEGERRAFPVVRYEQADRNSFTDSWDSYEEHSYDEERGISFLNRNSVSPGEMLGDSDQLDQSN